MRSRFPASILALVVPLALAGTASTADAQGLVLSYNWVDAGGGEYRYRFTLSTDEGWVPGMGWGGLIFADERSVAAGGTGVSPLDDFTMDNRQFPVGPWTSLTISSGEHNGQLFNPVANPWIPATSREVLTWQGVSSTRIALGNVLFSTLSVTGGAIASNFQVGSFDCGCICDFDTVTGPSICDLKDFLAFQSHFVSGDSCGCDIDTSTGLGVCDLFDWLAFQKGFVHARHSGCP